MVQNSNNKLDNVLDFTPLSTTYLHDGQYAEFSTTRRDYNFLNFTLKVPSFNILKHIFNNKVMAKI